MAKLLILEGPDAGSKFEFTSGRVLVGRGEECAIRLNQGSISRQHAVFTFLGDAWQLEDLNSQNGVMVQGEPITRVELRDNAEIRFGTINAQFETGKSRRPPQRRQNRRCGSPGGSCRSGTAGDDGSACICAKGRDGCRHQRDGASHRSAFRNSAGRSLVSGRSRKSC